MLAAKHIISDTRGMNKLPRDKRIQILSMLCEGSSMRSISRVSDVSINTVDKLLREAGEACVAFHDEAVRNVTAKRVQCDEIWSFTYAKQKNVATAKAAVDRAGDVWTWTAIDANSKLLVSWHIGRRDGEDALELMDDLRGRLANRVQLTTDGHKAYLEAVEGAFGGDVDYAQLIKIYGEAPEVEKRYSPAQYLGAKKEAIEGNPDPDHISTSYVERSNLSMRTFMRRFTRLALGFSKKFENHCHMVALYAFWYNFVKLHKAHKLTPAMAACVSDRLMDMGDIVDMIDARAAKPNRPATYRKREDRPEISK